MERKETILTRLCPAMRKPLFHRGGCLKSGATDFARRILGRTRRNEGHIRAWLFHLPHFRQGLLGALLSRFQVTLTILHHHRTQSSSFGDNLGANVFVERPVVELPTTMPRPHSPRIHETAIERSMPWIKLKKKSDGIYARLKHTSTTSTVMSRKPASAALTNFVSLGSVAKAFGADKITTQVGKVAAAGIEPTQPEPKQVTDRSLFPYTKPFNPLQSLILQGSSVAPVRIAPLPPILLTNPQSMMPIGHGAPEQKTAGRINPFGVNMPSPPRASESSVSASIPNRPRVAPAWPIGLSRSGSHDLSAPLETNLTSPTKAPTALAAWRSGEPASLGKSSQRVFRTPWLKAPSRVRTTMDSMSAGTSFPENRLNRSPTLALEGRGQPSSAPAPALPNLNLVHPAPVLARKSNPPDNAASAKQSVAAEVDSGRQTMGQTTPLASHVRNSLASTVPQMLADRVYDMILDRLRRERQRAGR